jgi:signal transduction histidine kinase
MLINDKISSSCWQHASWRALCLVAVLVLFGHHTQAFEGYSDPLQPPSWHPVSADSEVSVFRISSRLQQIKALIEQETQALNALVPNEPSKQFDAFGYHSDYIPAVAGVPDEPLWTLDFDTKIRNRRILGVVLVPAIDQRSFKLKGNAFPRRFRISSVTSSGLPGEVYVDWTSQDFPDPGMRPVVFKFPSQYALDAAQVSRKGLRLEVFSGLEEGGLEYFSLARVHLIRTDELHWPRRVTVSSSFESEPYWGADYLATSQHTLGMPLSAKDGRGGDLVMKVPASTLEKPLVLRIDLDEVDQLGKINIFPGHSPDGINVPGYGFPGSIRMYCLTKESETGQLRRHLINKQEILQNPGNNMLRFNGLGEELSAFEIECNDFPVYQGQAVFALGEIELFMRGRNLSAGRSVRVIGAEFEPQADLGLLVDGRVDGRMILPLFEWIEQMAAGKSFEARLQQLEQEHIKLAKRWQRLRRWVWGVLLVVIVVGMSAFVLFLLRSRTQAQARLRRQINSDLHDDVGSSLGSISLIAEQLQYADVDETIREDLCDLTLIAREAWASLREVVWAIDEDSIRLPELIQKLTDRANRVLAGVEISLEVSENFPDQAVSLPFKRHMIMYFKEVVHNCARHAHATHVCLGFRIVEQGLEVCVRDNGCGFDVTQASLGQGLESLRNRAAEMGGEFDLQSQIGEGTQVILRVPLKALLNKSDHAYTTSN